MKAFVPSCAAGRRIRNVGVASSVRDDLCGIGQSRRKGWQVAPPRRRRVVLASLKDEGQDSVGTQIFTSDSPRVIGFLKDFWTLICDVIDNNSTANNMILTAPDCKSMKEAWVIERINEYLISCRDLCQNFGETVQFSIQRDEGSEIASFLINKKERYSMFNEDDDDWDDWGEIDMSILDKYKDADKAQDGLELPEMIPKDDKVIEKKTFEWVQALVVDLGLCPFTSSSAARAGLPIGDVRYIVSRESEVEKIYREYWSELQLLLDADQLSLSTTLLITPEFCTDNAEFFDAFSQSIIMPMSPLGVEKDVQLVFFHPEYTFRDGAQRLGNDAAANFARRSPWPMINLLRTTQVRAAQRVIPTGLVYKQNEEILEDIGADSLSDMLKYRDWEKLDTIAPVDRRVENPLREAAEKHREETGEIF